MPARKSLASRERELEREQERLRRERRRLEEREAKLLGRLEERAATLRERQAREVASLITKNSRAVDALKKQQDRRIAALFKKHGRQMAALYRKHGFAAPPEPEPSSGAIRLRHTSDGWMARRGNGPARTLTSLRKEAPDSRIVRAFEAFNSRWPPVGVVIRQWFTVDEDGDPTGRAA